MFKKYNNKPKNPFKLSISWVKAFEKNSSLKNNN